MAETTQTSDKTTPAQQKPLGPGQTRTTTIVETSGPPPAPTKSYKLREGAKGIMHSGVMVQQGHTFELNEAQARAFRDRIEPVDDSEFSLKDPQETIYNPAEQRKKAEGEKKVGAKEEKLPEGAAPATQGPALPSPVVKITPGPATRDPNSLPLDPTALDPSRQGQQSREQRQLIDSGGAPPPKILTEKDMDEARKVTAEQGLTPGVVTAPPAAGTTSAGAKTEPKEGKSSDLAKK